MEPSGSYLFSVKWSPARPLVFAVSDGKGKIHIYDLGVNTVAPVLSFQASTAGVPIVSIAFSGKDASLLAVADDKGEVVVWQLSSRLSKMQQGEQQTLERLGDVDAPQSDAKRNKGSS
jgi:WD repeat-containing protein 34